MPMTPDPNTVLAKHGYVDLESVFNDRRDPHANPLSSSPRRMYARAPGPSALGGLVEQVYRGQPTHRAGDE